MYKGLLEELVRYHQDTVKLKRCGKRVKTDIGYENLFQYNFHSKLKENNWQQQQQFRSGRSRIE